MPRTKSWCKGCGACIIFVQTADGRLMPVEYTPALEKAEKWDAKTMINHWSMCPDANKFKNGKKGII